MQRGLSNGGFYTRLRRIQSTSLHAIMEECTKAYTYLRKEHNFFYLYGKVHLLAAE